MATPETYTTDEQLEIDAIKRRIAERLHDPKRIAEQAKVSADADRNFVHVCKFLRCIVNFPLAYRLMESVEVNGLPVTTPEQVMLYLCDTIGQGDWEGSLSIEDAIAASDPDRVRQ